MTEAKKAVYFFCAESIDPLAGHVFQAASEVCALEETAVIIDGYPVLKHTDDKGNTFYFARTRRVLSHDYPGYLPVMNQHFSGCDLAGIITWHEGEHAPDNIFTAHTTGDVASGNFGPADPGYMRNLLLSMEKHRITAGLDDFRVTTEATHWSGMVYSGVGPELIRQYPVPVLDIEIGSSPACWANKAAQKVLARSLLDVFTTDGRRVRNLLCAGGVHFEPAFAAAVFQTWGDCAFGVSHILANQWLVAGGYEEDGQARLAACVESIKDGIDAIAFHDNLKGAYKDQFRALAAKHDIPVFKHQVLRRPEDIPWR